MDAPSDMTERHARILQMLAERGAELACKLQEQAMAAEDPKEAAELALAFHRVARTVRQSLALEAKLERDARRGTAEDRRFAAEARTARVDERKAQVRAQMRRSLWTEHEASDALALIRDLDSLLTDAEHVGGFAADPLEAVIERLAQTLRLGQVPRDGDGAPQGPVEIKVTFVDADPDMEISADHYAGKDTS